MKKLFLIVLAVALLFSFPAVAGDWNDTPNEWTDYTTYEWATAGAPESPASDNATRFPSFPTFPTFPSR